MFAAVGPVAFFNCSLYFRNSLSRPAIFWSTVRMIEICMIRVTFTQKMTFPQKLTLRWPFPNTTGRVFQGRSFHFGLCFSKQTMHFTKRNTEWTRLQNRVQDNASHNKQLTDSHKTLAVQLWMDLPKTSTFYHCWKQKHTFSVQLNRKLGQYSVPVNRHHKLPVRKQEWNVEKTSYRLYFILIFEVNERKSRVDRAHTTCWTRYWKQRLPRVCFIDASYCIEFLCES